MDGKAELILDKSSCQKCQFIYVICIVRYVCDILYILYILRVCYFIYNFQFFNLFLQFINNLILRYKCLYECGISVIYMCVRVRACVRIDIVLVCLFTRQAVETW